jgi:hypothetical protein
MRILASTLLLLAACERTPPRSETAQVAVRDDKAACAPGLDAKVDAAMDVTERYLGKMADIFGDVDTADCETLRRELVALTPVAEEWTTKLTALQTEPMSDECKASFDERFAARGQAIQSSYGPRIDRGKNALPQRCGEHPGMQEAFKSAVRVKKKAKKA